MAITGAVLYFALGVWTLAREADDLERANRSELALVGRSVQVSLENALRDKQLGDITETLSRLDQIAPDVDLYVYTTTGVVRARSLGAAETLDALDGSVRDALERDLRAIKRRDVNGVDALVLTTPLRDDDNTLLGALLIARPLTDLEADLTRTRRSLAVGLIGFLVFATIIGHLVGYAIVGYPLRKVIDAIDAVRSGQGDARLALAADDELGQVATRFNAMLDELAIARAELIDGAESRRQQFEALKHADKLASVGQLSASLAHEIGSPLQTLISAAEWLAEQPDDPARTRRQATTIAEQGQRIARIVAQLLGVARRQRTVAPAPLAASVDGVLDLLEIAAKKRAIHISRSVHAPPSRAVQDAEIVQQILLNLVQNAMQATVESGNVSVDVRFDDWTDRAGARRHALVLTVDDDGPGVAPEERDLFFEPFVTTRAETGGSGLGLSIVRGLCQAHGGTAYATDSPLGGARFVAVLPIPEEAKSR